jgi:transcriptional regulator with XRE-family HTH domain
MDKPTLAAMRMRRQLSVSELARRAGVAASTIRRIEHGVPPHMETIEKLAQALDCAPETLDWPGDPFGMGAWR